MYDMYVCEVEYVHSPKMIRRREELKSLFWTTEKGKIENFFSAQMHCGRSGETAVFTAKMT
jgi:hypothetical protein